MIASLRAYFKGRIANVDAAYKQIDDPVGNDDIARIDVDCRYKIIFGQNSPEYTGNSYVEQIPVTIELYSSSKQSQIDAHDALYTLGINVKNAIISPGQIKTQVPFNDALIQSISIEALNTNDKTFKCTLLLTIRVDFTFN
jgi:hypothetical protein